MTKNRLPSQDDIIDKAILRRFPQRKTVFGRRLTDSSAIFYNQIPAARALDKAKAGDAGYTRIESAMASAAWTVARHFHGAYSPDTLGQSHFMLEELGQHKVDDPASMSQYVKIAARHYGAVLVGISAFDIRWVYQYEQSDSHGAIASDVKFAVVMAVPMDAESILQAPKLMASVATGAGYSRMAVVASSLAQFIRNLGYQAISIGNDTALSIPIAVDAGLGKLGRNGLLITKEYGPCIRLCKVFTDIPLVIDEPAEAGLLDFCKQCAKCASACEVGAISFDAEPSYQIACPSNNPGIKRWTVNVDKCYQFWMQNGSGCSSCIAACPFTQKALKRQSV